MELNNKTIDVWLQNPPDDSFRHRKRVDYSTPYLALREYLVRNVHDQVTIGANLKDPDILINNHGIEHIETVIERATDLLCDNECSLTALEIYVLLLCIQLHDVGNILGRYNHEINIDKIILEAENLCGRDTVEMIIIRNIAQAHGGEIPGTDNKDKISSLQQVEHLLEGDIRSQSIASILRLADELSDDKRRACTTLLKENRIPKKSEVFHAYASCLDNVTINHKEKTIELNFAIPKDYAARHFGKMGNEVLLLDEIYTRIMKMHIERLYCMRFLKGIIDIEKISASIKFYDKFVDVFPKINFAVSELGYPGETAGGIFSLCPALLDTNGNKIDGEYVKNKITGD